MLVTEFKFYRSNYNLLLEKYSNKYIVIKGKKVIGFYDTHADAYLETIRKEALGTFLIQFVSEKPGIKQGGRRRRYSIFDFFRLSGIRN